MGMWVCSSSPEPVWLKSAPVDVAKRFLLHGEQTAERDAAGNIRGLAKELGVATVLYGRIGET